MKESLCTAFCTAIKFDISGGGGGSSGRWIWDFSSLQLEANQPNEKGGTTDNGRATRKKKSSSENGFFSTCFEKMSLEPCDDEEKTLGWKIYVTRFFRFPTAYQMVQTEREGSLPFFKKKNEVADAARGRYSNQQRGCYSLKWWPRAMQRLQTVLLLHLFIGLWSDAFVLIIRPIRSWSSVSAQTLHSNLFVWSMAFSLAERHLTKCQVCKWTGGSWDL